MAVILARQTTQLSLMERKKDNAARGAAMALKTAVAPCAPMREEKQPGASPLDPANGTAAAVFKFATPQRVRRTLPELSRSRGFKQAGRFAFCPPGQKVPSRARIE